MASASVESFVALVIALVILCLSVRQVKRTIKAAPWYRLNEKIRLEASFYLAAALTSHDLGIQLVSLVRRVDGEATVWLIVLTLCIWAAWTALSENELQPAQCVVAIGSLLEILMSVYGTRPFPISALFVVEACATVVLVVHADNREMERTAIAVGAGLFVASAASAVSPVLVVAKCVTIPLRLFFNRMVTGHYVPPEQRSFV